ncbi:cellulose binding domain-containing protein [Phytohabitans kaempferiae]|uniref:Cellulose binding domain-containing protein n=1 Tax=Phytohabitans kaempferiae TaxID=1620943 RepID=A0ABV6M7C6_9ACTN
MVAALAGALAVVAPATAAHAAVACEVSYSISSWPPNFTANVQIRNTGDETWNGTTVGFRFTGNQTIASMWNHTWTQSGQSVTATSLPWVPPVAPGGTAYFGFTASVFGPNNPPVDWRVNGVPCVAPGAPAVIAEPDLIMIPEGTSRSFTVRLSHPPAQQVSLRMSITGTGTWASPPVILIFTPTNWHTPQSYSVMSMQDADTVDDRAVFTLIVDGYASDIVNFWQVDDD